MNLNVSSQSFPLFVLTLFLLDTASAQHRDKPRPEAWQHLAFSGRFMDRILAAPIYEGLETISTDVTRQGALTGRATHLYLAVIDVPKKQDLSRGNHSSKNIVLLLVAGRRRSADRRETWI
jgi:hypothetical protein